MLNIAGAEIVGSVVPGQVYLSSTENFIVMLMTVEFAAAKQPLNELATLIPDARGIEGPKHLALPSALISDLRPESINTAFKEQGVYE